MSNLAQMPAGLFTDNTKPLTERYRLCVLRWKKTDSNQNPHAAIYVQVPRTTITVQPEALQKALQASFEETQDQVIRDYVETTGIDAVALVAKGMPETVAAPEAVKAWYEKQAESKRLSKDGLQRWFDNYAADNLLLTMMVKQGITEETGNEKRIEALKQQVAKAREAIAGLSAPTTRYNEGICKQLQHVVALVDGETEIRDTLAAKLTKMLEPREISLALDL